MGRGPAPALTRQLTTESTDSTSQSELDTCMMNKPAHQKEGGHACIGAK